MTKNTRFCDATSAMAVNLHGNRPVREVTELAPVCILIPPFSWLFQFMNPKLASLLWQSRQSTLLPMEVRFNAPEWDQYFELRHSIKSDDVTKHFEDRKHTEMIDGVPTTVEIARPSLLTDYGVADVDATATTLFNAMSPKAKISDSDGPFGWRTLEASTWKVNLDESKARLRDAIKIIRPAIIETALVNRHRHLSMWPEVVELRERIKDTINQFRPLPLKPFDFWDGITTSVPRPHNEPPCDQLWNVLRSQKETSDDDLAIRKLVATIENHPLAKLVAGEPDVAEEVASALDRLIKVEQTWYFPFLQPADARFTRHSCSIRTAYAFANVRRTRQLSFQVTVLSIHTSPVVLDAPMKTLSIPSTMNHISTSHCPMIRSLNRPISRRLEVGRPRSLLGHDLTLHMSTQVEVSHLLRLRDPTLPLQISRQLEARRLLVLLVLALRLHILFRLEARPLLVHLFLALPLHISRRLEVWLLLMHLFHGPPLHISRRLKARLFLVHLFLHITRRHEACRRILPLVLPLHISRRLEARPLALSLSPQQDE